MARNGFDVRRWPKQTAQPTPEARAANRPQIMHIEDARILEHGEMAGGYRLLVLRAPRIAPEVQPGQFVHMRIPHHDTAVLRRPFSVYWTEQERLAILYKTVGAGTRKLSEAQPGESVSIVGPLGHGFPAPPSESLPVLVAGGYGSAALYMVARKAPRKGVVFVGAKTQKDVLCAEAFSDLGWDVRLATEDGSCGFKGVVTLALERWLETASSVPQPEFFACGPNAMLKRVGEIAAQRGFRAWISLDRNMGCGVGACLTCVQRIRTEDGGWHWERCCKEGPVFDAARVLWNDEETDKT